MYYVCKNSKRLQEKLKVGDKVKIISDKKVISLMSQGYSLMFGFDFGMYKYCGKEFVITEKEKSGRRKDRTMSVAYGLWYAKKLEDQNFNNNEDTSILDYIFSV